MCGARGSDSLWPYFIQSLAMILKFDWGNSLLFVKFFRQGLVFNSFLFRFCRVLMNTDRYKSLLQRIFLSAMKELGFGRDLRSGHKTILKRPGSGQMKAYVKAMDLEPYFSGHIHVDFEARRIKCVAMDYKTPADGSWDLEPDEKWWKEASDCVWPIQIDLG